MSNLNRISKLVRYLVSSVLIVVFIKGAGISVVSRDDDNLLLSPSPFISWPKNLINRKKLNSQSDLDDLERLKEAATSSSSDVVIESSMTESTDEINWGRTKTDRLVAYPILSINFLYADAINCSIDLCELAWLIRDNHWLLPFVTNAVCFNGTAFNNLNFYWFANCPKKLLSQRTLFWLIFKITFYSIGYAVMVSNANFLHLYLKLIRGNIQIGGVKNWIRNLFFYD